MTDGRLQILVVDDDESFREMVGTWLAPRYDVDLAASVSDAMEILEGRTPDLAILDVMMPETSGIEMFRMLRSRDELKEIPVLFLTAHHQVLAGEEQELLDRCRVLLKPFRLGELEEQIQGTLADCEPPGPSEE